MNIEKVDKVVGTIVVRSVIVVGAMMVSNWFVAKLEQIHLQSK